MLLRAITRWEVAGRQRFHSDKVSASNKDGHLNTAVPDYLEPPSDVVGVIDTTV